MSKEEAEERSDRADDRDGDRESHESLAARIVVAKSSDDPEVAKYTAEYLRRKSQVLEAQLKDMDEEQPFQLERLQHEASVNLHERLKMRLNIGFQTLLILGGLLIAVGVGVMVRDAVTSHRVVIELFEVPPSLAARGISGKVMAAKLLDELTQLQSATRADAAKRDLSNAWSNEIRLEVPETGITVGEISHALRDRFGHDVHISGDLVETGDGGLSFSVRGDGVAPKSFTGAGADLDTLTRSAAEYVYSKAEPVLWAYYLLNLGRNTEAVEFSQKSFAAATPEQKPYLLNTWANGIAAGEGKSADALALYRSAVKFKPDYWVAHNNIIITLVGMGREEDGWNAGQQLRKVAGGRPGNAPETYYQNWDPLVGNYLPLLAALRADAEAYGGVGAGAGIASAAIADVQMRLHDSEGASITIKTIPPDVVEPITTALLHFVQARLAEDAGDREQANREVDELMAIYEEDPSVSTNLPGAHCGAAAIAERGGRAELAERWWASRGKFVDCVRFRGDALDRRGDWAGAQRAYADAVALAPNLPGGFFSWGHALLRRGDLDGALRQLKQAHMKGPGWADPLAAWGDVLAKMNQPSQARVKYEQALALAPEWVELKAKLDRLRSSKSR